MTPAEAGAVEYESDNTKVATVNKNTGEVNVLSEGSAKITASFAGNDSYKESSIYYITKVSHPYKTRLLVS